MIKRRHLYICFCPLASLDTMMNDLVSRLSNVDHGLNNNPYLLLSRFGRRHMLGSVLAEHDVNSAQKICMNFLSIIKA